MLLRSVFLPCAVLFFAASIYAGPVSGQTVGLGLAQANNCMSCHRVDRKVVGPAFSTIAQRFAGNPEAADYLAQSIVNGSRGRWGPVPMPRQAHVSPNDARALAQWILSLNDSPADKVE